MGSESKATLGVVSFLCRLHSSLAAQGQQGFRLRITTCLEHDSPTLYRKQWDPRASDNSRCCKDECPRDSARANSILLCCHPW